MRGGCDVYMYVGLEVPIAGRFPCLVDQRPDKRPCTTMDFYLYMGLEVGGCSLFADPSGYVGDEHAESIPVLPDVSSTMRYLNLDTAITAMSALMIVMLVPSGLVGHVTGRRAAILATDEFSKPLADELTLSVL